MEEKSLFLLNISFFSIAFLLEQSRFRRFSFSVRLCWNSGNITGDISYVITKRPLLAVSMLITLFFLLLFFSLIRFCHSWFSFSFWIRVPFFSALSLAGKSFSLICTSFFPSAGFVKMFHSTPVSKFLFFSLFLSCIWQNHIHMPNHYTFDKALCQTFYQVSSFLLTFPLLIHILIQNCGKLFSICPVPV